MMRERDLWALREGEADFNRAVVRGPLSDYLQRMSTYYNRRGTWAQAPLEVEDLLQIARLELWSSVRRYRLRCTVCPKYASTREAFLKHMATRHPDKAPIPRPTLMRWVHGCVGRALDHEVRRYTRRRKFHGEMPIRLPAIGADQESAAELAWLIAAAQKSLGPTEQVVFQRLLLGSREDRFLEDRVKRFVTRRLG